MQGKSQTVRAESPSTTEANLLDRRIHDSFRQSQALYAAAKSCVVWAGSVADMDAQGREVLDDLREALDGYEQATGITVMFDTLTAGAKRKGFHR